MKSCTSATSPQTYIRLSVIHPLRLYVCVPSPIFSPLYKTPVLISCRQTTLLCLQAPFRTCSSKEAEVESSVITSSTMSEKQGFKKKLLFAEKCKISFVLHVTDNQHFRNCPSLFKADLQHAFYNYLVFFPRAASYWKDKYRSSCYSHFVWKDFIKTLGPKDIGYMFVFFFIHFDFVSNIILHSSNIISYNIVNVFAITGRHLQNSLARMSREVVGGR